MSNPIYALWGKENEKAVEESHVVKLISSMMGVNISDDIWSGYVEPSTTSESGELREILEKYIAKERISFEPAIRMKHSVGMGGADYARILDGGDLKIVDAVIFPNESETAGLLRAREKKIQIIVHGGGTSVTGSTLLKKNREYLVSLDTSNMNFINVDPVNMIIEVGAGVPGPKAEEEAEKFGLTLGNFPESFYYSTVGGWISTNAAGQESNRYGKTKDMVIGVRMETPIGTFEDRITPGESAFFKVSDIAVGSEGNFGVITRAWMRLNPKPKKLFFSSYIFPTFEDGIKSMMRRITDGHVPMILRLSDDVESSLYLAGANDNIGTKFFKRYIDWRMKGKIGSLLIVVSDNKEDIDFKGGIKLGSLPAKYWYKERYSRPYIYNKLLKMGIIAETVETSAKWSLVNEIYESTREVFRETSSKMKIRSILMCHASHEYATGSALYFTFLFHTPENKEETVYSLRDAIVKNIILKGGSISHHHGIGTIQSKFLPDYKGNTIELIRAVKRFLDPDGILGPGL
ncbi:MAG: FAD-binding oxidoreductase [Thermoplasmatales archaeon]